MFAKKNNMDFILKEDNGNKEEIIFRFHPITSHVHSFDEFPPKTWEEVYKTYYDWEIFIHSLDKDAMDVSLFEISCDECSTLPSLARVIKKVIREQTSDFLLPMGWPSAEWQLEYREGNNIFVGDGIVFTVFENSYNRGYKFFLENERALGFCDYLDCVNAYMLSHGEPI